MTGRNDPLAEHGETGEGSEPWHIRVDTGGTFTDCVARHPDGTEHRAKVLSTSALRGTVTEEVPARDLSPPTLPTELRIEEGWGAPPEFITGLPFHLHGRPRPLGIVEGYQPGEGRLRLGALPPDSDEAPSDEEEGIPAGATFEVRSPEPAPLLAARLITGTPAADPLPELALRLATTRATNALLERQGPPVALFVTRGFGDVLRIGDQQRPELFALDVTRAPSLPEAVLEVRERLASDGSVVDPLSMDIALMDGEEVALVEGVDTLLKKGIGSAAVVLLHAYRNPEHEERMAAFLRARGVPFVATSADVAPFIHLLRRAETTVAEAYLGPVIRNYVDRILEAVPGDRLLVMTSAGGLVRGHRVQARDTLLSGPAGGVVGAALVGRQAGADRVIALDMGGTSTDVSRYDGEYEYLEEHRVGTVRLRAPAMAIETVAAGGGSICGLDPNGLTVGPQSAGADPGPACYGAGGPLTLTDVNLLLGRIDPARFQIPVEREPAERQARRIRETLRERSGEDPPLEVLLEGFLELANERMADAIRRISVRKGYDPTDYTLVAFGGAGPQHGCAVARRLGIRRIVIPADAGVLSAVGLGHAVVERFEHRQLLAPLEEVGEGLADHFRELAGSARDQVREEGVLEEDIVVRQQVAHLRYAGQESTLAIRWSEETALRTAFENAYQEVYGHRAEERAVEVESLRVVASARPDPVQETPAPDPVETPPGEATRSWFDGQWQEVPTWDREALPPGTRIQGPALIRDRHSSLVVENGWWGWVTGDGALMMEAPVGEDALVEPYVEEDDPGQAVRAPAANVSHRSRSQAVREELFVQRFGALVTEMGEQLQRTALSVNIRERLDFSCALLDPPGRLVANAPHIPVHLGAMGVCVRAVARELTLEPGDVVVTNHPGYGGSHLPDVTVITPVFQDDDTGDPGQPALLGYVASRAHHAEIGGTRPGSMPPDAGSLVEEGVVIVPRLLVRGGRARWDEMRSLLSEGPHPTRTVEENLVDLNAQVAANHRGARLLRELARGEGAREVLEQMTALRGRAARRMSEVLQELADGTYRAREELDDGTPLQVEIQVRGDEASFDFSGSGAVHPGNLNATEAIVRSAVLYFLRLLAGQDLPLNEGLMEPIRLHLPTGLLNPDFVDDPTHCPAVVGGNVETSQRLVDTLLKPFELAACSQGTMNNVLFGDDTFSYYETVGGGAGAGPGFHGASATQVHMTNTRITDAEVMEHRFPVRVERFALRSGSGGEGRWRGGEGVLRELLFLRPLSLSVLTQHRRVAPYGLQGGGPGAMGRQRLVRADGREQMLEPVDSAEAEPGDRLILETPGGGGYGGDPT